MAPRSERPDIGLPPESAFWEQRYAARGRLWGDDPSVLARLAVARLSPHVGSHLSVLDVGCGYGRDARFLAAELGCRVLGVDPSPAAVAAGRRMRSVGLDVEYLATDLVTLVRDPTHAHAYDVVFSCNVYHLLRPDARRTFVAALGVAARPGGLLYLSTLSPRDAQHYAVGTPVRGEERSWIDSVYLHFCTAEELTADLADFDVLDLEERSYDEHNVSGAVHHHASWFLEGRRR